MPQRRLLDDHPRPLFDLPALTGEGLRPNKSIQYRHVHVLQEQLVLLDLFDLHTARRHFARGPLCYVARQAGFGLIPRTAMVPALLPVCPETIDQQDWRRLDERIAQLATEIEALARSDSERLTSVPGVGPLISSVTVAAIANGEFFSKGRDFAAWLGRAMSHVRERSGGHPTLDEGIAANHARADQLYALRRGSFLRFARALFQPEGWNRSYPKPITLGGGSITR